eukprot:m.90328 g.90328  ORF g.90328 m.90328 type:complete len:216 (-) comp13261_c1_seq5:23-670(-)
MAGKMWQPLVVEGENSWYVRLRQEMRTSNRAYIAGGTTVNGTKSDTVDVFDFASGKFVETLHLSTGRSFLATASLETAGLVFFAGGEMKEDEKNPKNSADADVVDIYSVEEGKFITPAKLSVPRKKLSATTLMDRWVIVAGGFLSGNGSQGYRAEVDVYDSKTNQWSQTKLFRGRMRLASASAGSCSVFAGGEVNVSQGYYLLYCNAIRYCQLCY